MVDITLVSYSVARLGRRVPPSDEGGGAEGDGGRDFLFEYLDNPQFDISNFD